MRASKEASCHAIFETCLILSVRLKLSPPGHFKGPRIRKYPRGSALYLTRKYPLRGHILGSGAPRTPGVNPKDIWNKFYLL